MDAFKVLEDARRILSRAFEELRESVKSGDALRVRDACEKGWLATVKAVDALLLNYGFEESKTHIDRRRKLRDLSRKVREVAELGIYDRVEARRSTLHSDGFHSGILTHEEVEEELRKVKKLIEDIEKLIKRT
ncbi:MAG: hypothetical protein AT713_04590 [Caldivirga sp. JCHS_4]|nr:MAG: hypothetical protein AT713_04590 [Caldivirga sp. JCHS_4]